MLKAFAIVLTIAEWSYKNIAYIAVFTIIGYPEAAPGMIEFLLGSYIFEIRMVLYWILIFTFVGADLMFTGLVIHKFLQQQINKESKKPGSEKATQITLKNCNFAFGELWGSLFFYPQLMSVSILS